MLSIAWSTLVAVSSVIGEYFYHLIALGFTIAILSIIYRFFKV